ncbi:MAG: hypothetical protein JWP78_2013 [Mucilaginibacter sp.]|nr:hypothetical protein [Mucilaginibacter sp.]
MKNLSHLFIAVLATALAFSSCKKSTTPAPAGATSSMKLTSNGTAISFNECVQGTVTANGVVQTVIIADNITNGKVGDAGFEVDIMHDPATLKAGQTYAAASSFGQADGATFFYYPNATDNFATQPANPQGLVTITGVTSTTITGTFSGKLFASDDFAGTTVIYTVTNGSFTAKLGS